MDLLHLRSLATRFRAAMLRCAPATLPINLRCFPDGACGDAVLLLAKYLEEVGFGPSDYVSGWRDKQSHAWLELNGVRVDITADQFSEGIGPVFVSSDRSWHQQFEEDERRKADLDTYDERTRVMLWDAYLKVVSCVEESEQ